MSTAIDMGVPLVVYCGCDEEGLDYFCDYKISIHYPYEQKQAVLEAQNPRKIIFLVGEFSYKEWAEGLHRKVAEEKLPEAFI